MSVSQLPVCPGMKGLPPEALQEVAAYFQTLSEPTRLQILNHLREGERNVGSWLSFAATRRPTFPATWPC